MSIRIEKDCRGGIRICFFIKCVLLIKILSELRSIAFESDDFIIKKEKIFSIDLARNGGK